MDGLINNAQNLQSSSSNSCDPRPLLELITWNMQGGGEQGNRGRKWEDVLGWFSRQSALDIACLQECSTPPPNPADGNTTEIGNLGVIVRQGNYLGTRSRPRNLWIYYYNWDNRVNQAIVSRSQAQDVLLLPNPLNQTQRSLLGIRINNFWVFSIHAFSGNGNDAPGFVQNVNAQVNQTWIIAGDYNRNPNWIPLTSTICPPNRNTHSTRMPNPQNKYDYAVWSQNEIRDGIVMDNRISDHFPVKYFFPYQME